MNGATLARRIGAVLLLFQLFVPARAQAAGTWRALAHTAPGSVWLMLLLPDGTVMAADADISSAWYQLTPDLNGSYANGSWSTLAPMHDTRLYCSSDVLTDGRVFVAGGEYGSGSRTAEVYDPLSNTWTMTPSSGQKFVDSISKLLPNGNVLVAPVGPSPGGGTSIYNPFSNTWTAGPKLFRGSYQDEASWVKLPDDSILTIDPFGTNSERYIPSLNQWIDDANVPVSMYNNLGELGAGFLLPDGRAFLLGGTGHTASYTPTGTTNAGVWAAGPDIPGGFGVSDGSAAMMVNGKVLCAVGSATSYNGPTHFYEFDPLANTFVAVNGPTGPTDDISPFEANMLDLPDGTVLYSHFGSQLYNYQPDGLPLNAGKPAISNLTQNLDGSYHLVGLGFNGISAGAAYGDDGQMDSNYPLVQMTDTNGSVFYARTFNWSSTGVMTSTNLVSTEFTLPGGLVGGSNSLVVIANGIASDPVPLSTPPTPLPAVKALAFTSKGTTSMAFKWNDLGGYETGYRVERSSDGTTFSPLATGGPLLSTFDDKPIASLGQYYYRVIATNGFGDGLACPAIFAASLPIASLVLPAPWKAQDIGGVGGSGASGQSGGLFTVIGSGAGIGGTGDQFQFVYQTLAANLTLTARVMTNQDTGAGAVAGVMFRSSLSSVAAQALMGFAVGGQNTLFKSRQLTNGSTTTIYGPGGLSAPCWVRLVRWGNLISGYSSSDGVSWTLQGAARIPLEPVAYVGLAVSSGTNRLLNSSVFDNVSLLRTASPQLAIALNGPDPLTNECHSPFVDPGVTISSPPANVAAGASNSLALKADGTVEAWGDNGYGQTSVPASATNLVAFAAGSLHALALRADGTVVAWGDDTYGQTDIPSRATNVIQVAAGNFHSLALKADGTVLAWGNDSSGQTNVPATASGVIAVAAGLAHSLALKSDGTVVAWGDNTYGQTNIPSRVTNVVAISAGYYHSLALRADGTVVGWGNNTYSQTNIPSIATNAVAVAAGYNHNLVLRANGTVVGWGDNSYGQSFVPATVTNVVALAAGAFHNLALSGDGTVVGWGNNNSGQTSVPPDLATLYLNTDVAGSVDPNSPGTHHLTYSAVDAAGISASATRTVVVADTTPPALTLPEANPLLVLLNTAFVDPGATATDACAGPLTSALVTNGTVDTSVAGTNVLNYTVTDPSGNTASSNRIVVVVTTVQPPVITSFNLTPPGQFLLQFPGVLNATYDVLGSEDVSLPLTNWTVLGSATRIPNGLFQFLDPDATNYPARFYGIRSP